MAQIRYSRRSLACTLAVGIACGCLAIAVYQRQIATAPIPQLRQLRTTLPDAAFDTHLTRLLQEPGGWSLGAKLLCDTDRDLAASADRILSRQFDRLSQQSPVDPSGLTALLRGLQLQLERRDLPAAAIETVSRWVGRILDHLAMDGMLADIGAPRREELLATCDAILAAALTHPSGQLAARPITPQQRPEPKNSSAPRRTALATPPGPLRPLPGGGLPLMPLERELPNAPVATPALPIAATVPAAHPMPQPEIARTQAIAPLNEHEPARLPEKREAAGRPIPPPIDPSTIPVRQLMSQLHQDSHRASAAQELTRRGFSQADLNLAAEITHPDVQVRRQIAQNLPRALGSQAEAWLLLLLDDADVNVRFDAATWLATSSDARVINDVLSRARREQDTRFQRLVQKLGLRQ
jgi:hypothetical protein